MHDTLYCKDNYLKEFQSKVVDCIEENGKYQIVLEDTAFYPEGGGQNADIGWIDEISVIDVQEKNGIIYHTVDQKIEIGKEIFGKIDFEKRFSNMQHHTAEHIVSGLICSKYDAENVGFHMGKDAVTIDFNVNLDKQQVEEIELLANEAVFQNLEVKVNNYNKEQIKDLKYRSKKELDGIIRIVEIPGYDICACCGIHVSRTGEIGMIKLLSVQKYKTGCRIELVCGKRALQSFNDIYQQIDDTSVLLSIQHNEVFETAKELLNKINDQKHQNVLLKNELFDLELSRIDRKENQFLVKENLAMNEVKILCPKLLEKSSNMAGIFSKVEDVYYFQIMSHEKDLRPIAKEITANYNGKGGGSCNCVQGQLHTNSEQINEIFKNYFL